jgi:hypothetical protein
VRQIADRLIEESQGQTNGNNHATPHKSGHRDITAVQERSALERDAIRTCRAIRGERQNKITIRRERHGAVALVEQPVAIRIEISERQVAQIERVTR